MLVQQYILLQEHMDTPGKLFLVLELAHVGELFDVIIKEAFSELKAKFYFYQMASAVDYLHKQVCNVSSKYSTLWNT